MECEVIDVRHVNTRFGERCVLTIDHPEAGEQEIWVPANDDWKVGQVVVVEESNGKFKLKSSSRSNGGSGKKATSQDNWKASADYLVKIFAYLREQLPDEDSQAIAKLSITLFLRK